MTNLDEANGDEFTLSENKPVRTSLSLKKHIEIGRFWHFRIQFFQS